MSKIRVQNFRITNSSDIYCDVRMVTNVNGDHSVILRRGDNFVMAYEYSGPSDIQKWLDFMDGKFDTDLNHFESGIGKPFPGCRCNFCKPFLKD